MTECAFRAPDSLDAAVDAMRRGDAMAVGGATSVGLMLRSGLIEPELLVYLGRIPGLDHITRTADALVVGATATLARISESTDVRAVAPSLAFAAGQVGNIRVRSLATMGGAIAHGDPRQDLPPVLLSLDAQVRACSATGRRIIDAADFFTGFMESALQEGELIEEVTIPRVEGRTSWYSRFTPASEEDYPTVGVAASIVVRDGRVTSLRVALAGVHSRALLVPGLDGLLVGEPTPDLAEEVAVAAIDCIDPVDDQRGSAEYKRAMVRVWTRRTLERCLAHNPNHGESGDSHVR